MAHTPRDELERVPTFDEQIRRRDSQRSGSAAQSARLCDSCSLPIDPAENRFRHVDCPPPPIPDGVRAVLERLRSRDAA